MDLTHRHCSSCNNYGQVVHTHMHLGVTKQFNLLLAKKWQAVLLELRGEIIRTVLCCIVY